MLLQRLALLGSPDRLLYSTAWIQVEMITPQTRDQQLGKYGQALTESLNPRLEHPAVAPRYQPGHFAPRNPKKLDCLAPVSVTGAGTVREV